MRFLKAILAGVLACIVLPSIVLAGSLEILRTVNVYEEPSRYSSKIGRLEVGQGNDPLIVELFQEEPRNGYYNIQLPDSSKLGWVYKGRVRRIVEASDEYVPYDRSLYRHWIDADRDCQDTRAEVLIRDDDDGQVEFDTERKCRVTKGRWYDPFTGKVFTNDDDLDIDHVVPLKNAHISGAWAWTPERRKAYANYLGNNHHLLAVDLAQNRSKGSKGPDEYLPPLESYHCEYVRIWVQIKEEWQLTISESERRAIDQVLVTCGP